MQVAEMDFAESFRALKGCEIFVYACVAKVEKIPLVTCDEHFEQYSAEIEVVNPTKK